LLPDLVDGADIGVVQCGCSLSFSLEASQRLGVSGYFFGQELQRDKSVEGYVLGLVDHTHAATAQLLDDAVVRDGLVDHERGMELWKCNIKDAKKSSQRGHGKVRTADVAGNASVIR
jgi:hypothetical protein